MRDQRHGGTLLELLVVLTLVAAIAGVATFAARRLPVPDPRTPRATIARARHDAVHLGRSVTGFAYRENDSVRFTARPDGSVVADSALHVERLTGVAR